MFRRPPISTRTCTLFPSPTLFRSLEQEVFAARHRLPGFERQRAAEPLAQGDALHRAVEPVAEPWHGDDAVLAGRVQRTAQLAHGGGEDVVNGDPAGPDLVEPLQNGRA